MLAFYLGIFSCLLSTMSASASEKTSRVEKCLLHNNLLYQKYLSLESKLNDDDQKRHKYLGAGKRKIWAQTVKDFSKVSSAHHLPAEELLFDAIEIEGVTHHNEEYKRVLCVEGDFGRILAIPGKGVDPYSFIRMKFPAILMVEMLYEENAGFLAASTKEKNKYYIQTRLILSLYMYPGLSLRCNQLFSNNILPLL